jgi:hypothetical protein
MRRVGNSPKLANSLVDARCNTSPGPCPPADRQGAEKVGDLSAMVGGVVDDMPHRRRELLLSMGKRI